MKGVLIKAHGSSDGKAIKNAVRQAIKFMDNKVLEHISEGVSSLGDDEFE